MNRYRKAVNRIGKGGSALSEALRVNTTLTTLYLGSEQQQKDHDRQRHNTSSNDKADNSMDEATSVLSELSEALKVNTTLTALDLAGEATNKQWQTAHNINRDQQSRQWCG